MKRFLETNSRLQFCDICVQGRKVWPHMQELAPGLVQPVPYQLSLHGLDTPSRMHAAPDLQVFLCEQLLYTKQDLDRHMKTGDEAGPLAESGFKVR
jgi:hypothetical protein